MRRRTAVVAVLALATTLVMPRATDARPERKAKALQGLAFRTSLLESRLERAAAARVAGQPVDATRLAGELRRLERASRGFGDGAEGRLARARQRLSALEGEPSPAAATPCVGAAAGTGSISGIVTDASNGLPLAGVTVKVYERCGRSLYNVATATTGGAGTYTTPATLATGVYFVSAESPGDYVDAVYSGLLCVGPCLYYPGPLDAGTPVTVSSPNATPGINFALSPGGTITGKVTRASDGTALANERLELLTTSGGSAGYTQTDATGTYVFTGVPTGSYFVWADSNAYLPEFNDGTHWAFWDTLPDRSVSVAAGATVSNVDIALDAGGHISGAITLDTAPSTSDVGSVEFYHPDGTYVDFVVPESPYTSYLSKALPAGTYIAVFDAWTYIPALYGGSTCFRTCDLSQGTPIVVPDGVTVPGIDFALQKGGSISGKLTSGGVALSSGRVEVFDEAGHLALQAWTGGTYVTDTALPSGNYYVRASAEGKVGALYGAVACSGCDVTTGTPVTVTRGSTTPNIDVALSSGARLSGRVADAPAGTPLGGSVSVYSASGARTASAYADCATGSYVADEALAPGNYFAVASGSGRRRQAWPGRDCGSEPALSPSQSVCDPTIGTPITVSGATDVSGVDFDLRRQYVAQDMKGFGLSHILWRHTGGALYVWALFDKQVLGAYLPPIGTNWVVQAIGDFNGDSAADILWRESGSGATYIWMMNSSVTIGRGYTSSGADNTWAIQGIGDFDGDGKQDILWRHTSGALYVWLMDGTNLKAGSTYLPPIPLAWEVKGIGDFDGDGRADLLWREAVSGASYLWLMNGAAAVGQGYTSSLADPTWSVSGVGDMNGDGQSDILWRHSAGAMYVWLMNGTTVGAGSTYLPPISTNWLIQGLRDFDGDGRSDVLWREAASGSTYVWLMNGAATVGQFYTEAQADNSWTIQAQK